MNNPPNDTDNTPQNDNRNDAYSLKLDMGRILWLISIGFFMVSLFFLVGYYLGSSVGYDNIKRSGDKDWTSVNNLSDEEIKRFSNIQQVKDITKKILRPKDKVPAYKEPNYVEETEIIEKLDRQAEPKERAKKEAKEGVKEEIKKEEINDKGSNKTDNAMASKNTNKESFTKPNVQTKVVRKKYSVQLATYKVKSNALFYKKKLNNTWSNRVHILVKKNPQGQYLYTLRIGKFSSLSDAKKARTKVQQQGHFKNDSFIIKG